MQVKLLRAIQEKRVRSVGAQHEEATDCRILSAAHQPLVAMVDAGTFRQDLYYRINVIEIKVPPLRERDGDILMIAAHHLAQRALDGRNFELSPEAQEALSRYPFPGNVRELENILERAVTLCSGEIISPIDLCLPDDLGAPTAEDLGGLAETTDLQVYLDDVERRRIMDALEKTRWNRTQAAKLLGISFRALRYRLEKLGID